jgi:hypothetical protein
MTGKEAHLLQRMGTRMASAPSVVELTDPEDHEDDLITDIMQQLGDTNPRSRKTYRTILRTFGKSLTYQLVGNTREAYRDGLVQSHKMAGYFVGTAKQQAAKRGLTLIFGPQH